MMPYHALSIGLLALSLGFYAMWIFAARGLPSDGSREVRLRLLAAGISLSAGLVCFFVYPYSLPFDDAAIIMKYIDNFRDGHFFRYNPEDPPVFGVSGPVHGLFAGALAYSGLLSPMNSLYASNFVGLVLVFYLSFRILAHYVADARWLYPMWALTVLGSQPFLINAKQGMEAPLHLAIVLLAFRLYQKRSPWLWGALSLAVISKLDAVPIAIVLGVAALVRDRREFALPAPRRAYVKMLALGVVLPLTIWIAAATAIFGSPLPHTAKAKFADGQDTSGDWYAFLTAIPDMNLQKISALLFAGYVVITLSRRRFQDLHCALYGLSGAAVYLLYLFFNPAEKMSWYYVVPDYLIKLQTILIVYFALSSITAVRNLRPSMLTAVMAVALFVLHAFYLPPIFKNVSDTARGTYLGQGEWIAAGEWIDENAVPDAKVLLGLGYPAWSCKRYCIDATGLNSPSALEHRGWESMIDAFEPDYIFHNEFFGNERYRLVRTYYTLVEFGFSPWRLYERAELPGRGADARVPRDWIATAGEIRDVNGCWVIDAASFTITAAESNLNARGITLGFSLPTEPTTVTATVYGTENQRKTSRSLTLLSRIPDQIDRQTHDWQFDLPRYPISHIEFVAVRDEAEVTLTFIDPVFLGNEE